MLLLQLSSLPIGVAAFESSVPATPTSGVTSVDAKVTSDSGNAFEVPRDAVGGESTLPGSSTLGVPSAAVVEVAIGAPLVAKVAPAVTYASDESTVPRAAAQVKDSAPREGKDRAPGAASVASVVASLAPGARPTSWGCSSCCYTVRRVLE